MVPFLSKKCYIAPMYIAATGATSFICIFPQCTSMLQLNSPTAEIPAYNLLSHHQLLELVSICGNAIVLRESSNCHEPAPIQAWKLVLAGKGRECLMLWGAFQAHTIKTVESWVLLWYPQIPFLEGPWIVLAWSAMGKEAAYWSLLISLPTIHKLPDLNRLK